MAKVLNAAIQGRLRRSTKRGLVVVGGLIDRLERGVRRSLRPNKPDLKPEEWTQPD